MTLLKKVHSRLHGAPPRENLPATVRSGFTVIEMLVVIALLAVLVVLLSTFGSRSSRQAREAVCVSNLRQISTAFQLYLRDNNMTLPPANSGNGWTRWAGYWYQPTTRPETSVVAYVGGTEVMRQLVVCPENRDPNVTYRVGGYAYVANYTVMPTYSGMGPPRRINTFSHPSKTIWIADPAQGSAWGLGANSTSRLGAPHQNCSNILWLDGHVRPAKLSELTGPSFTGKFP